MTNANHEQHDALIEQQRACMALLGKGGVQYIDDIDCLCIADWDHGVTDVNMLIVGRGRLGRPELYMSVDGKSDRPLGNTEHPPLQVYDDEEGSEVVFMWLGYLELSKR